MIKDAFLSKLYLTILLLFAAGASTLLAQNGTIKGKIIDSKTNEPLIGASVLVQELSKGVAADFDGNYTLTNIPAGTYTLAVSYVSYESVKKTMVVVKPGNETVIDFGLKSDDISLQEVEVVAKANRESENILMLDRQKALISKETIGAQQLSIQGISDAANAATRVTGVSKQEGTQTLNVRGLGDRYNSSTLNGLPLPSNHAEYKNIDLSLFSSDIIGHIGVEKSFTSNMYSDVAGANIDIVSKNLINDDFLQIGLGTGYNLNLPKASSFYLQDGPGFLGMNNFSLPTSLTEYSFKNSWNPKKVSPTPDIEFSLSGGKGMKLGSGNFSAFALASFDNEYAYNETEQRRVNGSDDNRKDLKGEEFEYQTHSIGLLNLGYGWKKNNIYFNSLYLHSSNQNLTNLRGYVIDIVGDKQDEEALIRRSDFERNIVFVNQLIGDHSFKKGFGLNWKLAANRIDNILPDRRHNVFLHNFKSDNYYPSTNDAANNHRYFHNLNENEYAATVSLSKTIGKEFAGQPNRGKITAGYSLRYKTRYFKAYQYNHALNKESVDPIDIWDVDSYFNDSRLKEGKFSLSTFFGTNNYPSSYEGKQIIHAGFASVEYMLNEKLSGLLGVRLENYFQQVSYETTLQDGKNSFNKLKPFPSLSLKYALNEKNNLRLGGSMTYTLPQFKETAPFLFEGITDATVGNPYLYPSTVYNGELKWEFFPSLGEIFTVSAFGKYIQDPINKFVMASASNDFSYANSGDWAYAYGIELEAKKNIFNRSISGSGNEKLSLGFNSSLMKTYQKLDKEKVLKDSQEAVIASFNKEHEVLEGAAPLLLNANLTYSRNWNNGAKSLTASLVYGYVSERLFLIGYSSLGNQYDKGFNDLQLVVKTQFKNLEFSLSGKNLLDPTFKRVQKNSEMEHTVLQYSKGVKLGFGVSYKF